MSDLAQEVLDFLRGTKTSEAMSTELRRALYVERTVGAAGDSLEAALVGALLASRPVVVTGSAGGGKTALLDNVVDRLSAAGLPAINIEDINDASPHAVVVVRDLTAVTGDRSTALARAATLGPLLLAANEGVLQDVNLPAPIQSAPDKLRELQLGSTLADAPFVLVDLAGLDPLRTSLAQILSHELLHEAVTAYDDGCASSDLCPRRMALAQLRDPRLARAVADLVSEGLGSGEVLFRDTWDLVADLFLGGTCDAWPPTSAWFWRLFHGDSHLSAVMTASLVPDRLALPAVSPYLYRGDWQRVQQLLGSEMSFVELDVAPVESASDAQEEMFAAMEWLRLQFMLLRRSIDQRAPQFIGEIGLSLEHAVLHQRQVTPLVQAINAYFRRREPEFGDSSALSLWVEMSSERGTDRAMQLVSLGQVSSTRLSIQVSQVIGGIAGVAQDGSRHFLVASNGTGGRLSLDARLFQAIARGRPVRTSDRSNDDADFALRAFFFSLVGRVEMESPDTIDLLEWSRLDGSTESRFNITSEGLVSF